MMKRKISIMAIVTIITFISVFIIITWGKQDKMVVATVDGEIISSREYENKLSKLLKKDIKINKAGEIALEECVMEKIQWVLMREKGILDKIDYNDLLELKDEENGRRKNTVKKKGVIYGPVTLQQEIFLRYLFNTGVTQLIQRMDGTELTISKEEIQQVYNNSLENYRKEDKLKIRLIKAPYVIDGQTSNEIQSKVYDMMTQLAEESKYNNVFEKSYKDNELISVEELTLGGDNARLHRRKYPTLYPMIYGMNVREVSSVINENGAYCLVEIIARESSGYVELEEASHDIRFKLLKQKYQENIKERYDNSNIVINKEVYNDILKSQK